ncbi:SRPBCC family protein [Mucilaginibacter psychrotolerans]|uniref:SRPBCC domain-containing protein n=1 Tax=Mucilaginibacter psychrotolerans TaxID=1524096 RepID=A0A4Y8S566_9SPHI|nr:SRPBCC family protein [Mucilaginibacter psychrotolerans]TFF33564.1 SRPBCC domain-containing protein [Mucilaginibacter psychrotolerans]
MSDIKLTTSISFNSPKERVWQGITDPEVVKQYFFGTMQESAWMEGSPITWSGEWEGKAYQDKGTIQEIIPGEYVRYTYWSSMGGTEDKPENYQLVSYKLDEQDGVTTLAITQDNIKDEAAKAHSEGSWQAIFGGLKKLLEAE